MAPSGGAEWHLPRLIACPLTVINGQPCGSTAVKDNNECVSTTTEQRGSAGRPWIWAVAAVCLAALLVVLSLADVPGATRRANGSCCRTEFVNGPWWTACFALVVPIVLAARGSKLAGLAAALAGAAAVFFIADTVVNRYVESGWGDGLESLGYVYAMVQSVVFFLAVPLGRVGR